MAPGLEHRLRDLPGVLDCSMNDAGVALLVHPEIDTRMLKARAQAIFAELGDPRPLVLVGGYPAPPPPARRAWRPWRTDPTPLSLTVFAILVLCLLAVVPISPNPVRPSLRTPSVEEPLSPLAFSADLAPDLFRAVGSIGRRAVSARAATVVAPVAAVEAQATDPARSEPPGRARAQARRAAAADAKAEAEVPVLAPARSTTVVSALTCPAPGNSGAHRHRPKKPKPNGKRC